MLVGQIQSWRSSVTVTNLQLARLGNAACPIVQQLPSMLTIHNALPVRLQAHKCSAQCVFCHKSPTLHSRTVIAL
jgi:hypothetical protein